MDRLAIITTHPIQYNAPLFSLLNKRGKIRVKVFYSWGQSEKADLYDPGFGIERKWDIPLLEGYDHEFIENTSRNPGTQHFMGIVNPGLRKKIKAFLPDAILVYGWSFFSHLKIIRQFKGKVPVFFRGDSTLLDEPAGFSFRKMMRRLFLKWVYRHVDIAFYTGTNNKKYFLAHGLKEDQLVFAAHAIDIARFAEDEEIKKTAALQWRRELGIADTDIVFLYAGKMEPKKNLFFLAEVFSKLNLPNTHLVMAGDGILLEKLKKAHSKNDRIHFISFQNQQKIPVLYRMGDVFVLPSGGPGETWGLSINEAMSCGRAVLVSNKCGAAIDLVRDNENGFIFESGNDIDLLEKMNNLSGNRSALLQMGQLSKGMIESWNLEQVAAVIENKVNEPIQ